MKLTFASSAPQTPSANLALLGVAVLLMLGGAALLVAGVGLVGMWIPFISVGIALTVIVLNGRRGSQ